MPIECSPVVPWVFFPDLQRVLQAIHPICAPTETVLSQLREECIVSVREGYEVGRLTT